MLRRTFLRGTGTVLGMMGVSPGQLIESAMKVAGPALGQRAYIAPFVVGLVRDVQTLAFAQTSFLQVAQPLVRSGLDVAARTALEGQLSRVVRPLVHTASEIAERLDAIQVDRRSPNGVFNPIVERCGVITQHTDLMEMEHLLRAIRRERWRLPPGALADARVAIRRGGAGVRVQVDNLRTLIAQELGQTDAVADLLDRSDQFRGFGLDATNEMLWSHHIDPNDFRFLRTGSVPSLSHALPTSGGAIVRFERVASETHPLLDFGDAAAFEEHQGAGIVRSFGFPSRDPQVRASQRRIDDELSRARREREAPRVDRGPRPELHWWQKAHRPIDELALSPTVTRGDTQAYLDEQIRYRSPLLPFESGHGNDVY